MGQGECSLFWKAINLIKYYKGIDLELLYIHLHRECIYTEMDI